MQINLRILKSVETSTFIAHVILVIAALLSGIATAKMMWLGSLEDHWLIRAGKVLLGLGLIEGSLGYSYHGIRKVFTNGRQRLIGWLFLATLAGAILCNLITERMLSRGVPLNSFQHHWIDWAFDGVVVAVMLAVGAIQLFSDDARLERQALKNIGEEAELTLRDSRNFPAALDGSQELTEGKGYRR